MKQINWSYHRNGCRTCARAQDFLQKHKIPDAKVLVDARKNRMGIKDALQLVEDVGTIYVTKGSKVVVLDIDKDRPSKQMLESLLIGPTGNLRAPTMKVGKQLLVGFDDETYKKVFCS